MAAASSTRLLNNEADQSISSINGATGTRRNSENESGLFINGQFTPDDDAFQYQRSAAIRSGSGESNDLADIARKESQRASQHQSRKGRKKNSMTQESASLIRSQQQPTERGSIRRKSGNKRRKKSTNSGTSSTILSLWNDRDHGRPALFVLFVCLMTYMFNQVDRYLISILSEDMQDSQGWGDGDGGGYKYDFLVGFVFTAIYLPAGVPMGYVADRFPNHRVYLLAAALAVWSLSVCWTGFSQKYWEVVVARFILAFAESACTPLAGSIITDWFAKDQRGTALGIYNFGIYTGYSMAVGVANILTEYTSWRSVWYIFGFSGLIWSVFVLAIPRQSQLSVKRRKKEERKRKLKERRRSSSSGSASGDRRYSQMSSQSNGGYGDPGGQDEPVTMCDVLSYFAGTPSIWLLFTASLIRNAGGYVWAYNSKLFFTNVRDQSGLQQGTFMSWIPLLCGSLGALFGGYVSDRFVKNASSSKRLLILVASNLCAAPFAFLALVVPCPYCYLCLIPSNIIGEMWVGICLALVVEFVPERMKTTGLAVYFFWIGMAGFFPNAMTPLQKSVDSYQWALILLFPGLYAASSVLFLGTFMFMNRDKKRKERRESVIQRQSLIN